MRAPSSGEPPRLLGKLGEHPEIDRAAPRMQVEQALRELGHLAEAAGDGDARHRVRAQIFQHAADEIAHVDQRRSREGRGAVCTAASEVEPVAPATCVRPAARATSMPRWIEWIQAEQE